MKLDSSILKETTDTSFNYEAMYKKCFVNISEVLPPPETVVGIGHHDFKGTTYLNPTFTKNEMSAIIAPQKSKKTFFKSAIAACYIGGNAQNHFPSVTSCREGEPFILDFDTEQGTYYAQRAFRRVLEMVGSVYQNYLPFGLKGLTDDEIVQFIDGVVNDPRYKGNIGMIFIDGIADLCTNTNDIEKSKKVLQKVMQWNEGCHVCGVIHKTFDKDRATGHLGSFVQKKAETTIFLRTMDAEVKNSPIEVKQYDSRGAPFDNFYFDLDLTTVLPRECEDEGWGN